MSGELSTGFGRVDWSTALKIGVFVSPPILLRLPDEKRGDLQVLINRWHCHEPCKYAFVRAHPCILLRFDGFPTLHSKNNNPVDFARTEVYILVFSESSGLTVVWEAYRG